MQDKTFFLFIWFIFFPSLQIAEVESIACIISLGLPVSGLHFHWEVSLAALQHGIATVLWLGSPIERVAARLDTASLLGCGGAPQQSRAHVSLPIPTTPITAHSHGHKIDPIGLVQVA